MEGFIHRASEFDKAFAAGQEQSSTDKIEKKPEQKHADTSKENKKKTTDVQALSISSREELQKILPEELAKLGYTKKNNNQRADNQNYGGSRNNQNYGNSRDQNNYNQGWQHSGNYRGRFNNRGINHSHNEGKMKRIQGVSQKTKVGLVIGADRIHIVVFGFGLTIEGIEATVKIKVMTIGIFIRITVTTDMRTIETIMRIIFQ